MITNYDQSVEINHNPDWPYISDHPYRILIIDGSGSGKTKVLLNLIKHQRPILLAQTKAGNNSKKLKNEIKQILYLLYQRNKITKKVYNNLIREEMTIVIIDRKTFCFKFDLPKDVNENLIHEIEFIINGNESLTENKMKNKIEQLLLKYKDGNNIHEHGKQKNE